MRVTSIIMTLCEITSVVAPIKGVVFGMEVDPFF